VLSVQRGEVHGTGRDSFVPAGLKSAQAAQGDSEGVETSDRGETGEGRTSGGTERGWGRPREEELEGKQRSWGAVEKEEHIGGITKMDPGGSEIPRGRGSRNGKPHADTKARAPLGFGL